MASGKITRNRQDIRAAIQTFEMNLPTSMAHSVPVAQTETSFIRYAHWSNHQCAADHQSAARSPRTQPYWTAKSFAKSK